MRNSEIDRFETRLLVIRQIKQVSAAIIIGVLTMVFLDSVHILSSVLHSLNSKTLFPFAVVFTIYSVCGAFGLGMLARYAFIRHLKNVQADIGRVAIKRKLAKQSQIRKESIRLTLVPVRLRDTSYEPLRRLRRA